MIYDNWFVPVRTLRPLPNYMRLSSVGYESRSSADYHFEGRFRSSDRHAFFQFTLAGRGVFRDAAGEHDLSPGRGFLCRASDPGYEYYYPPQATEPWVFVWIAVDGQAALDLTAELVQRHGAVYELATDDPLLAPFLSMRNASGLLPDLRPNGERMPQELDAYASARLAGELLLGLGQSREISRAEDAHALLAHKAQRLIRDNLGQELNASQLAEALAVSREHLARVFREQTGDSPYAFIQRQKILRACRYLKESNLSQKEIAAMLGFTNLENFSRSFKRLMKLTPGEYRRHGALPVE